MARAIAVQIAPRNSGLFLDVLFVRGNATGYSPQVLLVICFDRRMVPYVLRFCKVNLRDEPNLVGLARPQVGNKNAYESSTDENKPNDVKQFEYQIARVWLS